VGDRLVRSPRSLVTETVMTDKGDGLPALAPLREILSWYRARPILTSPAPLEREGRGSSRPCSESGPTSTAGRVQPSDCDRCRPSCITTTFDRATPGGSRREGCGGYRFRRPQDGKRAM